MSDTNCPYCGAGVEINHDDGYGYEEGQIHQQDCHACEKTFVLFHYETHKADCMNGGEHNYKEVKQYGWPEPRTLLRCEDCEHETLPTPSNDQHEGREPACRRSVPAAKPRLDRIVRPEHERTAMKAYREDGDLVIEISEDALCNGTHFLPGMEATVTDREKFLDFCAKQICSFGDTGDFNSASHLTRLLDALMTEAIESDAGVEV